MSAPVSKVARVTVRGPLADLQERFTSTLVEQGYTPLSRVRHLQVMVHLSKWMRARDLSVADLTMDRVQEYLAGRRHDGYTGHCSRSSLRVLWQVLTEAGASIREPREAPPSEVEMLLGDYARFLRCERGLAASTIRAFVLRVRRFLDGYGHDADLSKVGPADVTAAVLAEAGRVSASSTQFFVVALRSFLRYGYLTGRIGSDLSAAALPVTGRRCWQLPRGIPASGAKALLASCDRRIRAGRRDYAVLLVLCRLGLRAGEVARLRLEDLDWRAGQVVIHGKGQRLDRLPLPGDVGGAIAGYLRRGRPNDAELREVFVSSTAPWRGLGRSGVSSIVRRACVRAGLPPVGAHRLRHALAVDMVAAGVPLSHIGQVLRHRDPATTSIYARVDVARLRTISRPWAEGLDR